MTKLIAIALLILPVLAQEPEPTPDPHLVHARMVAKYQQYMEIHLNDLENKRNAERKLQRVSGETFGVTKSRAAQRELDAIKQRVVAQARVLAHMKAHMKAYAKMHGLDDKKGQK